MNTSPTQLAGFDCFCRSIRGAAGAGGDFCELICPDIDGLVLGIGTLFGGGPAGSLLVRGLSATLHARAARGGAVEDIADELNRTLWEISPDRTFAALFCARIDKARHDMEYVNAGNESALLIPRGFDTGRCGAVDYLGPNGPVLGLSRKSRYHSRTVRFGPGDTLAAFTEGAADRACAVLNGANPGNARELAGMIVAADCGASDCETDRTAVTIHFERALRMAAA